MSDHPEALETAIAMAMYKHTNPHIGDREDYFRAEAKNVIKVLGLHEEAREVPVTWVDTGMLHYVVRQVRYVTDWIES